MRYNPYENDKYFTLYDVYQLLENKKIKSNGLTFKFKINENQIGHMQQRCKLYIDVHHSQLEIDSHSIFNKGLTFYNKKSALEMIDNLITIAELRLNNYLRDEDTKFKYQILREKEDMLNFIQKRLS